MSVWYCLALSAAACVLLAGCGERSDGDAKSGGGSESAQGVAETVPEDLADEGLAGWFIDRGRYTEALPVVERVVAVRRSEIAEPLRLGEALMSLGMVRDALGDSSNALPPLAESWELFQSNAAPAAMLGACADALGLVCQAEEKFDDAERAFLAAIEYRKAASPDDDEPWVSVSRMHLGRLYLTLARYEEAEPLLRAALATAKDDVALAARSRQLAAYHHALGAYSKAIPLFESARDATVKAFGADGAQAAAVIGDLGLAQLRSGDLGGARKSLETSHRILAGLPEAAPDLRQTSAENLATFYLFVGEAKAALPLLEGGSGAVGLNNLGSALHMTGDFESAADCFARAYEEASAMLESRHPLRVQILQNLACLRSDLGEKDEALAVAREAGVAAVELLDHLLGFGSESQKLDFRRTSDPLSLLCSFGAEPEEIAAMLFETKGVVLDSLLVGANGQGSS